MTEDTPDEKSSNTSDGSGCSSEDATGEYRFVLPEVRDRAAFLAVFERDDAFGATRTRMRDDMVASLQCLAPLAERVRAQSFLERLTASVLRTPAPADAGTGGTESFESLGEALPAYVEGVARTVHGPLAARGVSLPPRETAHILLDWLLQPFFSKFVIPSLSLSLSFSCSHSHARMCTCTLAHTHSLYVIGDDRAKDEALLEVYATYDYRHDAVLAPWTQLTRAELTRVCRWFAALDATASLLDKAEAVLTIVTHLTTALGRAVPQPLTPDDLVDGLTFLVMRLKPNRVCANIAFLLRFAPDTMMNGELGYAVTTFAVVLQALLLRGCADGKDAVDRDWVVFRRGRRRITEAEGRRLLADFMEDCVVIEEPHATCAGPTPPPEAAVAHTGSGGDGDGNGGSVGSDDICKEWVLM